MVSKTGYVNVLPFLTVLFILPGSLVNAELTDRQQISEFSNGSLASWQEKSFAGKTDYQLVKLEGEHVLRADSNASASGLFKEASINLKRTPYLNWRWRVANQIESGDERKKSGDDYVARLYLVINHKYFFWKSVALSYVWANKSKKGEVWNNAFAGDSVKMLALRSADDETGLWLSEKRNVFEDLKQVFGKEIYSIDAVAIMTDTDNSSSKARAYYADIFFSVD